MSEQDSHVSQRGSGSTGETPSGPIRMQHRAAMGEKVNGQTNPNGASTGPTDNKVGNAPCTY